MAKPSAKPVTQKPIRGCATAPSRSLNKRDLAVALMERPGGATIDELTTATGWLLHSTRAIISGLRKEGRAVTRTRRDGVTCYAIGEIK